MLPVELQHLTNGLDTPNKKISVGDVIFFGYKSRDSFYDMFPLVLVLSINRGRDANILGFNLHFMPPDMRLLLLDYIRSDGVNSAKEISREKIPRRYFTNAIKSYSLSNILTNVNVFGATQITQVINSIVPIYDSKTEINIVNYLGKVFIEEKRGQ